jgi:hypothetical protein
MNSDFGLLVPKNPAEKSTKEYGRTFDFCHIDWDDHKISRVEYDKVLNSLKSQASIIDRLPSTNNLYLDVKLTNEAKTKRPSRLWKEAKLEIVEIRRNASMTLAGTKRDFTQFAKLVREASFDIASGEADKVSPKEMNIARELFAVSALEDHNADVTSRLDEYLLNRLADLTNLSAIDCIIELKSNIKPAQYEEIYISLMNTVEGYIEKKDIEYFYSNFYYVAQLSAVEVEKILKTPDFNSIRVIKRSSNLIGQRSPGSMALDDVTIESPRTSVRVAIVDSGTDSRFLDSLRDYHKKETKLTDNKSHGTFTASRAIFGHDLDRVLEGKTRKLEPVCRFIDLQVLGDKLTIKGKMLGSEDTQDVVRAIVSSISRFPDIKIYNISIAQELKADPKNLDTLTVTLDKLSNKYDVLFIVAVGNHKAHLILPYDKIFNHKNGCDVGVAAPGDSINSLSVGSVVYKSDDKAMAIEKYFPSPFTRIGSIRGDIRKPELVEVGGNFKNFSYDSSLTDNEKEKMSSNIYGVVGIKNDSFATDIGTSFSTPMVTYQAALTHEYVNMLSNFIVTNGNVANLIRALLVHSTSCTHQPLIINKGQQDAFGAGIPNFDELFSGGEDRTTIVYCGEIDMSKKVHKLRFKIPKFLIESKSKFTFTFAYNPPVDSSNLREYNQITLQPSLRTVQPDYEENGRMKHPTITIGRNTDWKNIWKKGGTCLHFTSTTKPKLETDIIEVRIMASMSDDLSITSREKTKYDITQKYAFVLSVEDMEKKGALRSEMTILNQFEVVNRNRIQVS